MSYKTILIPGGAGFVGSNLAVYLKKKYNDAHIICFDNLMREGSVLNVTRLEQEGITFVKGDVRNQDELLKLPAIDLIIECSAEPSVLAGYENPQYTIDTNLNGTRHCLVLAKRDDADIIFLSTSRVYPIDPLNTIPFEECETRFKWLDDVCDAGLSSRGVREEFTVEGFNTLYGETKLSSERLIQKYGASSKGKCVINRCGVIAGPWQMGRIDQGIVGFWIARHVFGGDLNYIGYEGCGKQVRDMLHIDDVCDLIAYQIDHMDQVNGEVFNVGGGEEISASLFELTRIVSEITDLKKEIGIKKEERPGDVRIYITDNAKVTGRTGWIPRRNVQKIVQDTYDWMIAHKGDLKNILS